MNFYLDSSALLQLYYPEKHSSDIAGYVNHRPVVCTHLHDLEMRSALMQKVFRAEVAEAGVLETVRAMDGDLKAGVLIRPSVSWPDVFKRACGAALKHTGKLGCRSLDVLHVACAVELGVKEFVSFDDRQTALADNMGLRVIRFP